MKNEAEVITRLKSYGQLWNGWTYNGRLYGSGGSGCVLGLSRGEEKSVIKVINIDDNQLKYNAVKDEIETMVTLRSEYLVECLNYRIEEVFNRKGERIGYDFLIRMNEYEPFSEFLREEEYDPNELCVQLARDIGGALCVLHSNGILHRDIKPENIFIDNSSGERRFRLGDFGVSKRIGDMSGLTTTGTLNFMAPESFKYYEYSYRSDIYNLGMTLYYILNDLRFPVFSEEESQSDFDYNTDCRLHGEKLPLPVYGSGELKKVVIKSCEANPKDRYKDISDMLNDLFGQNISKMGIHLKVEANPIIKKMRKRKKRMRIILIESIILLVVLVAVFAFVSYSNRPINSVSSKYENSKIDQYVNSDKEIAETMQNYILKTTTYNSSEISLTWNYDSIIFAQNKSINMIETKCEYEYYYGPDGTLFYIYSNQGDSIYQIYLYDNDIIRVLISGVNVEAYDYGDKKITVKYQKIVDEANKLYSEIKEQNPGSFTEDTLTPE